MNDRDEYPYSDVYHKVSWTTYLMVFSLGVLIGVYFGYKIFVKDMPQVNYSLISN